MAAIPAGERPLLAGVELGGTKCICILGRGPGEVDAQVVIPTRQPAETLSAIRAVLEGWRFAALGIGSFGPLNLARGAIEGTPKLGWSGTDLRPLGAGFDVPVKIDTDVNGAALAEGRWGDAQGLESWTYVTVGTGVGVGSIVNRRPVCGLGHSEAGHMRVPRGEDRWPGICAFHGDCVEGLICGPAIAARAGRSGSDVSADDPIWLGVAAVLGSLCHNLLFTTAPQRILIGGGVMEGQPALLDMVREAFERSVEGYAAAANLRGKVSAFVVRPRLGPSAGPMGTLALASSGLAPFGEPFAPIGTAAEPFL
ncbi:MAG TPA: ROK family protein [Allosphingosinicella sp.]|jgi:fructokinase